MKCFLKFGPFTTFIDMPSKLETIYIPHPLGILSMTDSHYGDVAGTVDTKKLEFAYKRVETLFDEEVAIYEFKGVS
jgi:hypothetical protein